MKRFFQLSLKTVLALITVVAIAVGYLATHHHEHQREQLALEKLADRIQLVEDAENPKPPPLTVR